MKRITSLIVASFIVLTAGAGCIVRERRPATVVVHEDHHHDHDHHW